MPNNFGGDQMDPDYAPFPYPHKDKDRDPPEPVVPAKGPTPPDPDRRIRSVVGDYRVVIPDGTQKGSRFYTNNSPVVIEKRSKDAMGADKWDRVTSLPKPAPKDVDGDANYNRAIYWLLAGPDSE